MISWPTIYQNFHVAILTAYNPLAFITWCLVFLRYILNILENKRFLRKLNIELIPLDIYTR